MAGLTVRQAGDPTFRIDVKAQIKLLNLVASALNDDCLGVGLAQELDLRELGLLFYVPASSDTLGAALRNLARYSAIHNEGVRITYREGTDMSLAFDYTHVARWDDRHQIEFFVMTILRICRQLTSRNLVPKSVRFIHHRSRTSHAFGVFFGNEVSFGEAVDEISFSKSTARVPIASADPYLNALLVRYCDEVIATRRVLSGAWRSRAENAAASLLPHGQARLAEVARQLGVSQRTLGRHLEGEGVTFSGILDDLRCDLAKRYLQEAGLPVSEVAWLLGYKEASAFNHAFKRWTGKTPKQMRNRR
jgi:AraC-like DNA-binding protein